MSRSLAVALALGAGLQSLPARAEDSFNVLTESEQARVERGEIVVHLEKGDTPIKRLLVVGQVAASASEVFRIYTDYEHYPEIFGLKSARIVSHEGDVYTVKVVMGFPWPVGERWVMNETRINPGSTSFTYHRLEGSVQEYVGSFTVLPKGPSLSEVHYVAKIDPGIAFLPGWLLERFQEAIAPSSIALARDYLKRHHAGS